METNEGPGSSFKNNHQVTRSITLKVIENRGAGPGSFLRQTLIQVRISETNVYGILKRKGIHYVDRVFFWFLYVFNKFFYLHSMIDKKYIDTIKCLQLTI